MADDDLTPSERVRRLEASNLPNWRAYYDAMDEEEAFLDGERYVDDSDWHNRDRRLVQIRGRETEDAIRHIAAEASQRPRNLQAKPRDKFGTAAQAEVEAQLVERELADPMKGFDLEYYKTLMAARMVRLGVLWMDWVPDRGPYGEIVFGNEDARNFMWDLSWEPHHPCNGWMLRKKRLQVDYARRIYKAPWLEPDRMANRRTSRADQPIMQSHGLWLQNVDDDKTSIWECWYKNDLGRKYRENGALDLKPQDRYMACADGCGYRSDTQGQLQAEGKITGDLPPAMEGCPGCMDQGQQGMLQRIDSRAKIETLYQYSQGKRLCVVAPFNLGGDTDGLLYEGNWPVPSARSYPAMFLTCQVRPGRPMGHSDVSWGWDQQIASDQLSTLSIQRVFEHRDLWVFPRAGIVDANNRRYERRDDQKNVAFRDATVMGPLNVEQFSGTGLDPAWAVAYQTVQGKLTQYRGVADFGLTPQDSKNIPVGTVERITQQANLPTADFERRNRAELAKLCSVLSDYIHATYPAVRVAATGIEGIELVLQSWGEKTSSYHFAIEDSPPWTGTEKARGEAFQALLQIWMQTQSVELVQLAADQMHYPASTVDKLVEVLTNMQQAAPPPGAMGPGGASPGPNPGASDLAPAPEQAMTGSNGVGMSPMLGIG